MTPVQHYREAERLLKEPVPSTTLEGKKLNWDQTHQLSMAMVATAQVHATLATVEAHTSVAWSGEVKKP